MTDEENGTPASKSLSVMDDEGINAPELAVPGGVEERDVNQNVSERPRAKRAQSSSSRNRTDLENGKSIEQERGHVAFALSIRDAMGSHARIRSNIKKDFEKAMSSLRKRKAIKRRNDLDVDASLAISTRGRLTVQASHFNHDHSDEEDEESGNSKSKGVQYRLSVQIPHQGMFYRCLAAIGVTVGSAGFYDDAGGSATIGCLFCGINLNNLVMTYLNWTFRASFFKVIFSAAVFFYIFTLSFALLIFASGVNHPNCIHVNGQDFGQSGKEDRFSDAYALSWATFTTVGYGLVFPSTSGTAQSNQQSCSGIQFLCTIESFVGLLFASFCGAIVFGKVARTRSHAQVEFSDPIVVRYGKGVEEETNDDSSSDDDEEQGILHLPCPVLEFRVLNRMASIIGGEIMDAEIKVVASIDESQVCSALLMAAKSKRRRRNLRALIPRTVSEQSSLHSNGDDSLDSSLHPTVRPKTYQAVEGNVDGEAPCRRIFAKLEVGTPEHPFFKRVWTVCHTLNANSPLLSKEARRRVSENDGSWPADMNNYAAVRASIRFDQILVSLSGTSSAGANNVYAQKVYDYVDMNIGYRFANVLYRNLRDGSIGIDRKILNDVLEQAGGGAEPLVDGFRVSDVIVV